MFNTLSTPDLEEEITHKVSTLSEDNLLKVYILVDELLLKQDICRIVNSSSADSGSLLEAKTAVLAILDNSQIKGA